MTSKAPRDRGRRREDVLLTTVDERCETARYIAHCLNYPLTTVRRDLEWLEERGFVRGVKHDERDTLPNGRIRVYWSPTERGTGYAAYVAWRDRRTETTASETRP